MRTRLKLPTLICIFTAILTIAGKPKLPIYVGVGYDLLFGNPLSDHVDPGFMHPIFKWTYDQNKILGDNFLIPDQLGSSQLSACTFS